MALLGPSRDSIRSIRRWNLCDKLSRRHSFSDIHVWSRINSNIDIRELLSSPDYCRSVNFLHCFSYRNFPLFRTAQTWQCHYPECGLRINMWSLTKYHGVASYSWQSVLAYASSYGLPSKVCFQNPGSSRSPRSSNHRLTPFNSLRY